MEGEGVCASRTRPTLRGVVRFCINTLRVLYVREVGAAAAATACRGTQPEELPPVRNMGNLQSEAKKRNKKGRGAGEETGSVGDALDATDPGDDADTERTLDRKPEEQFEFERVRAPYHGKRQAPKPPGTAVRKVGTTSQLPYSPFFFLHIVAKNLSSSRHATRISKHFCLPIGTVTTDRSTEYAFAQMFIAMCLRRLCTYSCNSATTCSNKRTQPSGNE